MGPRTYGESERQEGGKEKSKRTMYSRALRRRRSAREGKDTEERERNPL